jgi:hypothetical protein
MKKFLICIIAFCIVLPVLANAGSVSSRYDVTFGGFVKYDLGYSSTNNHADAVVAPRSSTDAKNVLADDYGNSFQTAAETRLNFLVKGPELWGAKTSAFIEGDFRGVTTGNSYGGFQLRHAFMTMNWSSAELMIGQNWQQWGMPYYGAWIGTSNYTQFLRGIRTPQIAFRYFFTKEFNAMIGLTSAAEWSGTGTFPYVRQYNDDYARSGWPGLMGEIAFWSDRCGKIGANNLKFGLGGYFGKEKKIIDPVTGTQPATAATYVDDTINAWIAAFRYSIPIIPEKQGNKAMALLLNGNFFIGQNVQENGWMGLTNNVSQGSYWRANNEAAAPTMFGLFTQASFWFTNSLSLNGLYGYLKYNYSAWARGAAADATAQDRRNLPNMIQQYGVTLLWDATQAIRFGLEWTNIFTSYNGNGPAAPYAGKSGTLDQYRVAAYYFF